MKLKYCLTHESWVGNLVEANGRGCIFVSCPPPELDMSDEWVDSLLVPSHDELYIMNQSAIELEAQFVGED